jgi:hypothetical protein
VGVVRTNWHLDALDLPDDSDPMQQIAELKSHAAVIDLSQDEAMLRAELRGSLGLEAFLYREYDGLCCELKLADSHVVMGGSGLSCYGCALYTKDPSEVRSLICREGRRQEDILGQLAALTQASRLDHELMAAHEDHLAACDDLVAMCSITS